MDEHMVLAVFNEVGAVIDNSHVVYTSGKHGRFYLNKDALYTNALETSRLCLALSRHFIHDGVEVVVAPAVGGIALSQEIARCLTSQVRYSTVRAIYSERAETALFKAEEGTSVTLDCGSLKTSFILQPGEEIALKHYSHTIRPIYAKLVANRNVLIVEDVINTGGTVQRVIEAIQKLNGKVVGVAALCNQDNIEPPNLADIPKFVALANIKNKIWNEADCPLCQQGVPINTAVGHGQEFLARKGRTA